MPIDLVDPRWIVAKGAMFAVIVVLSATAILLHDDPLAEATLLVACLWAACRFYYFLFHVLERWVGIGGKYRGMLDLALRLRVRRRANR